MDATHRPGTLEVPALKASELPTLKVDQGGFEHSVLQAN